VIPEKYKGIDVVGIGFRALYNKGLTSVSVPNSIQFIAAEAFSNNDLTTLFIPESVLRIDRDAFKSNKLNSVVLSAGLLSISNGAFFDNNLTEIIIPESLKTIEDAVFRENQFTNITIEGDTGRFNRVWVSIGFPSELKPGLITFEGFIFDTFSLQFTNVFHLYNNSPSFTNCLPVTATSKV
jgi:hypothetical protein